MASTAYSLTLGLALSCAGFLVGAGSGVLAAHQAKSEQQSLFTNASAGNFMVDRTCTVGFRRDQLKTCFFGPESGATVVLAGDSHAGQWIPAMIEVANREHWRVITLIKASCPLVVAHIYNPKLENEEPECATWREKALAYIANMKPSIVLMSSSWDYVKNPWLNDAVSQLTPLQWEDGTRLALVSLNQSAAHVVLLRDTPHPGFLTPVCLSRATAHPHLFSASACDIEETRTLTPQVWQAEMSAARGLSRVSTLDLTDRFCQAGVCPARLSGMVVYRDSTHMTFAFAASLEPILADRLRAVMNGTN